MSSPPQAQGLPRLLLGVATEPTVELNTHLGLHGPLPDLRRWAPGQLIEMVDAAGLRGRGGASFPVAAKLRAAAKRRGHKFVLANGAEGEPASKKDRAVLRELPHLVLDGISLAAVAVGSREAVIAVPQSDRRALDRLHARIVRLRAQVAFSGK